MPTTKPPPSRPAHFSLIRSFVPADFLTLANGCCGSGSVLAAMHYRVRPRPEWQRDDQHDARAEDLTGIRGPAGRNFSPFAI